MLSVIAALALTAFPFGPADPVNVEIVLVFPVVDQLDQRRPLADSEPGQPILELERGHLDACGRARREHRVRRRDERGHRQPQKGDAPHLTSWRRR